MIAGLSKEDARARVETFALEVFASADTEDRAGPVTSKTAAAFFAAYVFMDVCHQFGELALDIEQKVKYAMWKATDINRAIKEGRTPRSGGVDDGAIDYLGDVGGGEAGGGLGSPAGSAGSAAGGAGSAPRAGGGGGGGSVGFLAGGGDGGGGAAAASKGAGKGGGTSSKASSWQDEEDERMAQRYAASLPSAPTASATSADFADDEEKGPDESLGGALPGRSSVLPVGGAGAGGLPSSYLPSSPLPPPLPPQPSSHETARAFGFTVDGSNAAAPQAYSPGFTGPVVPRPSLPPPPSASSPSSGYPPVAAAPPSSSRYSPAPPSMITPSALPPVLGKSRVHAAKEAERLLKHASSALSFDDVDTTIVKLQQAVALLYPHKSQ